jgi:hypothetical protein
VIDEGTELGARAATPAVDPDAPPADASAAGPAPAVAAVATASARGGQAQVTWAFAQSEWS